MSNARSPSPCGTRVRRLRERAGLTTRELDRLAGLTKGHATQVENMLGARVSARTIVSIARVFGVSAEYLLDGVGAEPRDAAVAAAVEAARGAVSLARAADVPPPPASGPALPSDDDLDATA